MSHTWSPRHITIPTQTRYCLTVNLIIKLSMRLLSSYLQTSNYIYPLIPLCLLYHQCTHLGLTSYGCTYPVSAMGVSNLGAQYPTGYTCTPLPSYLALPGLLKKSRVTRISLARQISYSMDSPITLIRPRFHTHFERYSLGSIFDRVLPMFQKKEKRSVFRNNLERAELSLHNIA